MKGFSTYPISWIVALHATDAVNADAHPLGGGGLVGRLSVVYIWKLTDATANGAGANAAGELAGTAADETEAEDSITDDEDVVTVLLNSSRSARCLSRLAPAC